MAGESAVAVTVGPSEGLPPWTFATSERRILALDYSIEELVSLRHAATAALRIRPVVRHVKTGVIIPSWAYGRLTDSDVEAIDRATLEFASRLRPSETEAKLPLIIPQSFRTLAGRRGRANLVQAAHGSTETLKAHIIVEITEVGRGTPSGRLNEVASLLGAMCKGVFGRLQAGRDAAAPFKDVRLQALALDAGDIVGADSDVAAALLEVGEQIQGLAPLLIAQGLPADGFSDVAEVAGFTHVATRAQDAPGVRA
ncbi:hypothetical protein LJR164_001745 [Phenylobacterium sp. LjRoot164]